MVHNGRRMTKIGTNSVQLVPMYVNSTYRSLHVRFRYIYQIPKIRTNYCNFYCIFENREGVWVFIFWDLKHGIHSEGLRVVKETRCRFRYIMRAHTQAKLSNWEMFISR